MGVMDAEVYLLAERQLVEIFRLQGEARALIDHRREEEGNEDDEGCG